MTAVKSGKLEKHRKYYLFNKKRGKKRKPKTIIIQNSIQLLHTLLGACTGGWISQCSRGLFTNRVVFLLLVSSTSVNMRLFAIFGYCLANSHYEQMKYSF